MPLPKGTKLGGRGCPRCGSHNTEGLPRSKEGTAGVKWCLNCKHRWFPCSVSCRGYTLQLRGPDGPLIKGCQKCDEGAGIPDKIAREWPEAYRAMAGELGKRKSADLA